MADETSSTESSPDVVPTLDEITAFERLVADGDLDVEVARPHLCRAWKRLHESAGTEEDLLSWAGSAGGVRVEASEREQFDGVLRWVLADGAAAGSAPTSDALFAHSSVLRALVDGEARPRPSFAIIGVAMVVSMLVLMVFAAGVSIVRGPSGPWRGEWFDNPDFEGEPQIRHARKIEFNWGKGSAPVRGLGADRWSVIFRTCLDVAEETDVRFRVTSDDGTKLFVDGELVVDNWGAHAARTRTGKATLTAGTHYIRLDYFEASATAEVKLLAAFGEDGDHGTIPVSMLSRPSEDGEPCG